MSVNRGALHSFIRIRAVLLPMEAQEEDLRERNGTKGRKNGYDSTQIVSGCYTFDGRESSVKYERAP